MRDRYWHNMAGRIQRAWRGYVRHRNEMATRIQRFWKNQKEGLAYARKRDYGHQVLGGRKERRRFSLLGMRRFMGDYLDVGGRSAQGEMLRNAAGLGREYYRLVVAPRLYADAATIQLRSPSTLALVWKSWSQNSVEPAN
jgi:hypothetical protein